MTTVAPAKIRILFLGANPSDTTRLALGREVREITQRLRTTPQGEHFELVSEWAVRIRDLQAALLRYKPQIVHFSGHGRGNHFPDPAGATREFLPADEPDEEELGGEILVEDDAGMAQPIPAPALADLFRIVGGVHCVVLNACHSAAQAEAIRKHVDAVVGMSRSIEDSAAIHFAWAFYQGLGFGNSVGKAFELGKNQIDLAGLRDGKVPTLLTRVPAQGIQSFVGWEPASGDGAGPRATLELATGARLIAPSASGNVNQRIAISPKERLQLDLVSRGMPGFMAKLEQLLGTTLVEKYRLDGLAQVGASFAVYRGTDLRRAADIAIKLPYVDYSRPASFGIKEVVHCRGAALREWEALLRHESPDRRVFPQPIELVRTPNPLLKGRGNNPEWTQEVFLIEEWVEGESLDDVRNRLSGAADADPCAFECLPRIAHELLRGLSHIAPEIFVDISPRNFIWEAAKQTVRIVDAGSLAQPGAPLWVRDDSRQPPSRTLVPVTLMYLTAAEVTDYQCGKPRHVSAASNAVSIGKLLHELSTNRHPLMGKDVRVDPSHFKQVPSIMQVAVEALLDSNLQEAQAKLDDWIKVSSGSR